ncbi:MAG TPA: EpsD family peptidyl-prolyl cis-trans isomerase, partial [Rhodocyclaceae bacterium]
MKTKPVSRSLLVTMMIGALAVSACGNKAADKAATQVVAKVNGSEISLHQVNMILSKLGNVPAGKMEQVRKSVVDRLIDQELLAAKAVDAKLDRTPETLMALELARREILARAYIDQAVASGPKMSPRDVSRYYAEHPELFAQRRIYAVQEIGFQTPAEGRAELQALVDKKAPAEKIQEWLKAHDIAFNGGAGARPAEQIPSDLLKRLVAAKDGDLIMQDREGQTSILRLAGTRLMPIDEATAAPAIQRYLLNQHVAEITEKELKAIKAAAKIEYVGTFADLGKPAAAPAATPAAAAPAPAAAPAAGAPSPL